MNQEITPEQFTTIQKIAKQLAPRYVFGSYERDDIEQEATIMALDGLKRYDGVRPLENFLYTHVNNRLKNFKRDNFYRITTGNAERAQQAKKDLFAASVSNDPIVCVEEDLSNSIDTKEAIEKIDRLLPAKYRADYLKMTAGAKVSKKKKMEIYSLIQGIVGENYE
jgi:DNA-directed RNA polymerase specialized sigma24 family protein